MQQSVLSYCASCPKEKVSVFRAVFRELAKIDADLAVTLRAKFLAAGGGCLSKAVGILFSFTCDPVPLYPCAAKMRAFYESYMEKYPSLAQVFYANYDTFQVAYLV